MIGTRAIQIIAAEDWIINSPQPNLKGGEVTEVIRIFLWTTPISNNWRGVMITWTNNFPPWSCKTSETTTMLRITNMWAGNRPISRRLDDVVKYFYNIIILKIFKVRASSIQKTWTSCWKFFYLKNLVVYSFSSLLTCSISPPSESGQFSS